MKNRKEKVQDLIRMENFLDYNQTVEKDGNTFEKLMFIYFSAIKELQIKIEIIKDELKIFYDYNLIDHIKTRIKEPDSIIKKMKDRGCELTYKEMIENINDIAGIRIVCGLKKDIFSIKDLIKSIPGIHVLKEKDYVIHPKESGYSSYHLIVEVPVCLSQNIIYVKVEIQIRTMAMDFFSYLEHKMKYKTSNEVSKKMSREWINCAKMVNKLDNKIMLLNE